MEHLRIDPDIDTDPGLEEAGWCAARVYELLLKVCAKYDLRGLIPQERQSAAWLARRWNLTAADLPGVSPEDFITNGVARLFAVGKLIQEGDGWVIKGWEKFYSPRQPSTPRVQAHRARMRGEEAPPAPTETPETVSNVSPRFGNSETPETTHHTTPPTPRNTTPQPTLAPAAPGVGGEAPLVDRLGEVFAKVRGVPFVWTRAEEERLRALAPHPEPEVLRRWEIALGTSYPRCSSIRELAANWNAYAQPQSRAGPVRDVRRGVARAEDQDHSRTKVQADGTVDF